MSGRIAANATTPSQWVRPLLETLLRHPGATFADLFDRILRDYSPSLSGGTDLARANAWLVLADHLATIGAVRIETGTPCRFHATHGPDYIERAVELQNRLAVGNSLR